MTPAQLMALRLPCRSQDERGDPVHGQCLRCDEGQFGAILILTVDLDDSERGGNNIPPVMGLIAWHASIEIFPLSLASGAPNVDALAAPTSTFTKDMTTFAGRSLERALEGVGAAGEFWMTSASRIHLWRRLTGLERELAFGRMD